MICVYICVCLRVCVYTYTYIHAYVHHGSPCGGQRTTCRSVCVCMHLCTIVIYVMVIGPLAFHVVGHAVRVGSKLPLPTEPAC